MKECEVKYHHIIKTNIFFLVSFCFFHLQKLLGHEMQLN